VMTANLRVRGPRRVSRSSSSKESRNKWYAKQCTGRVFAARSEACIHTLPRVGRQFDHLAAPVLGRGGCPCVWTVRSQGSAVPTRGTFVVRDNRLANSVQTHLFRYRQCGSCRQARALDPALLRLARRGGGGRWRTLRATDALEGAASRVVRSGAQGKRPTRGGRKCENALELRGRASAEFPGQAMHGAL